MKSAFWRIEVDSGGAAALKFGFLAGRTVFRIFSSDGGEAYDGGGARTLAGLGATMGDGQTAVVNQVLSLGQILLDTELACCSPSDVS